MRKKLLNSTRATLLILAFAGCGKMSATHPPTPADPSVSDTSQIIPSSAIPSQVTDMNSNNNLDVIQFGGKVFLAFRTSSTHVEQTVDYEWAYWWIPKRCSLWKVDPATLTTSWVLDLPSRGDTCFASVIPRDDYSYWVYNYSSPIDGPDLTWHEGQMGDTHIYRSLLTIPE